MTSKIFQGVLNPTHLIARFGNGKSDAHISYPEVAFHDKPHHKRKTSTQTTDYRLNPKRDWLLRQYRKVRRWGTIASAISNVISGLLSAFIQSIMMYVIYKFYTTRDIYIIGRPWGPWAKESVIWPTFMFAAASIITFFLALAALVALCYRSKRQAAYFSSVYVVMHVVAWIVVSILYRVEKTEKDLWGWSCTDKAKAIQQQLGSGKLNFESLCKLQASSWGLSIAQIVIKILTSGVSWYFDREQSGLKTELIAYVGATLFDQLTG